MRIRGNSGKNGKICQKRENLKKNNSDLKSMDVIKIIIFGQKLEHCVKNGIFVTVEGPSV